jgi:hypothetical protein
MTGSNAYPPGPLFYYLMAVPQRLGVSPWIGGVFVALLHTMAGLLLFDVARRAFDLRTAFFSLAIFVFAPWDILYADRIWLSCVAPVWGTAILWLASCELKTSWEQGLLVGLVLTLPQLHMSAPLIWAACACVIWLGPKVVWRPRAILIGALLAILTYSAPIFSELTHDFANTRAMLNEGGGRLELSDAFLSSLRVFAYAVLYGSSEIAYHYARGYRMPGPFDEVHHYFSAAGWADALRVHGPFFLILNRLTLLFSLGSSLWLIRRTVRSLAARKAGPLALADRLVIGISAGLVVGALLLLVARKNYYPHYSNMLMPMLLLPVGAALGALFGDEPSRRRGLGLVAATASIALAMGTSAFRYYLEIDRLNGLDATMSMVEEVISGPMPAQVHFDGFNNRYAWEMLANTKHHHALRSDGTPAARWRVHNGAPTEALLERIQ